MAPTHRHEINSRPNIMQIGHSYHGWSFRIAWYLVHLGVRVFSRFFDLGISSLALGFDKASLSPWSTRTGIAFRKPARYFRRKTMAYLHGVGEKIRCVLFIVSSDRQACLILTPIGLHSIYRRYHTFPCLQ